MARSPGRATQETCVNWASAIGWAWAAWDGLAARTEEDAGLDGAVASVQCPRHLERLCRFVLLEDSLVCVFIAFQLSWGSRFIRHNGLRGVNAGVPPIRSSHLHALRKWSCPCLSTALAMLFVTCLLASRSQRSKPFALASCCLFPVLSLRVRSAPTPKPLSCCAYMSCCA